MSKLIQKTSSRSPSRQQQQPTLEQAKRQHRTQPTTLLNTYSSNFQKQWDSSTSSFLQASPLPCPTHKPLETKIPPSLLEQARRAMPVEPPRSARLVFFAYQCTQFNARCSPNGALARAGRSNPWDSSLDCKGASSASRWILFDIH